MKKILFAVAIALSMSAMTGCTQIDTGNVGVKSVWGQVSKEVMAPDVYFTAFKTVTEVCAKETALQINDLKPQTSDKITLQDLDIDVYVQINPTKASEIVTKWNGDLTDADGEGCSRAGMNYVTRQAREAIYSVTTEYGSATIHTERSGIASKAVDLLQTNLDKEAGKGMFFVRSANVRNLVTDVALEANIKAAAQAQFKLQEEKNRLEVAKVEADRKRAEAQGEADSMRIKAEAISKQGGEEYVKLKAIEKWDGKLPTTTLSNTTPFVNVK